MNVMLQVREQLRDSFVNHAIRLRGGVCEEGMPSRHDQRVSQILPVLHHAAAGPAAHEVAAGPGGRDLGPFPKVAEGHRRPLPAIHPQQRLGGGAKQDFIDCHVQRGGVRLGVEHFGQRGKKHRETVIRLYPEARIAFGTSAATLRSFMPKPAALGKGLSALINVRVATPTPIVEKGERIQVIPLSQITPTPLQPRSVFRDENLQELVDSIKEHGIIQPLICRKKGDNFELIAGERRWRAAQRVGLPEAPVIVRIATDQEVLELALIENLQREDLNPIEEATAFSRLAHEFGLRQEDIAQKVGKSRAAIANAMRLLDLEPQVQSWLVQSRISVGHAKVLLSLKSGEEQALLAEEIIRRALTVRAAEKLVAGQFAKNGTVKPTRGQNSQTAAAAAANGHGSLAPALLHLQNRLQQHLATHVTLQHTDKRGSIEIEYYGTDDLHRLLAVLGLHLDGV